MGSTTFVQPCPVCGRRLIIENIFADREVNCYHCHAKFTARKQEQEAEPEGSPTTITLDPAIVKVKGLLVEKFFRARRIFTP